MKSTDPSATPSQRRNAAILLDANESPFNAPDNRYPETQLSELVTLWGRHERIPANCTCLCNGTEEAVDLVMRTFLTQQQDNVVSVSPTRHIYARRARANRLEYREAPLHTDDYSLHIDHLLAVIDDRTRLVVLCSPNSPTGNLLKQDEIAQIAALIDGYVVVDESYIDFTPKSTVLPLLNRFRNLIVVRSFSHAWSAAGLRLAAIVAHPHIVEQIQQVGLTHPLSTPVMRQARQMMERRLDVDKWVRQIIEERTKVEIALRDLPECEHIYPSSANFLWVRFTDSQAVCDYLAQQGIAVRCMDGFLRITIGLPAENSALLGALRRRMNMLEKAAQSRTALI